MKYKSTSDKPNSSNKKLLSWDELLEKGALLKDTIQRLSQLRVVLGIVLAAIVRDFVERRKGDVDVAGLDQLRHVPVQES